MKRLIWIGSTLEDLKEFPESVRRAAGYSLHLTQMGERPERTKVLSGFGNAKILEIRENERSGTYRTVYTAEFQDFIFVLHAFQKKSAMGVKTPKQEVFLIKQRLKDARDLYKQLKTK